MLEPLNNRPGLADTGEATTRRLLRWTPAVVAMLIIAAARAPAGGPPPPPGPLRTGDQNGPRGSCPVFPSDNAWNTDVSTKPLRANSDAIVRQVNNDNAGAQFLHADFGGGGAYGIPYVTVAGTEPRVPINFTEFG